MAFALECPTLKCQVTKEKALQVGVLPTKVSFCDVFTKIELGTEQTMVLTNDFDLRSFNKSGNW